MITRSHVAVALVVLLSTMAGCGFLLGTESLSFSASPATVSDATLSETGYEETEVSPMTATREFTVAGQTREVEVTNQLARYDRQVDLGPLGTQQAAVFAVFASPTVEIGPESFNPIADMGSRELLSQFESSYQGLEVGERVGSQQVTVLGSSRTVERYAGTATFQGQSINVFILITDGAFQHGSDYVVAVGIYPQQLQNEQENAIAMFEGIEHADDG